MGTRATQTAGEAITPEPAAALFAKSEGHPLLLFEAVRGSLTDGNSSQFASASGAAPSQMQGVAEIPTKIYTLISARLGRLSTAAQRRVSIAAVIGRDFTYEVLHAATSMDEGRWSISTYTFFVPRNAQSLAMKRFRNAPSSILFV